MIKAPSLLLASFAAAVSFAPAVQAQDAAAGEKKAAMCLGCHNIPGYQASFPQVHKVPKIGGQGAKYIAAALTAYKKGERKHPTMGAIAGSLSDQDIADLAAFYEKQGGTPVADAAAPQPPADVASLLSKGACNSCHGPNFNKPIDPSYPKLACQYGDYLYVALRAYGTEGNAQEIGRAHV